jgi:hypothetical protein
VCNNNHCTLRLAAVSINNHTSLGRFETPDTEYNELVEFLEFGGRYQAFAQTRHVPSVPGPDSALFFSFLFFSLLSVVLCRVVLCCVVLCRDVLCRDVLCFVLCFVLCCVLCRVVSCCVVLCCVVSCCVLFCCCIVLCSVPLCAVMCRSVLVVPLAASNAAEQRKECCLAKPAVQKNNTPES